MNALFAKETRVQDCATAATAMTSTFVARAARPFDRSLRHPTVNKSVIRAPGMRILESGMESVVAAANLFLPAPSVWHPHISSGPSLISSLGPQQWCPHSSQESRLISPLVLLRLHPWNNHRRQSISPLALLHPYLHHNHGP
jgi:hypothetical protein